MTELGGATTAASRPARLVVAVGGGIPSRPPKTAPVGLTGAELAARLDEARRARHDTAEARRSDLAGRLEALDADLAEVDAELDGLRRRRQARDEALAADVAAIAAISDRRRANLAALTEAVAALSDATTQWCRTTEQQQSADAALDLIVARLRGDDAPADPRAIAAEMAEGEAVLQRTEAARRARVDMALDRLVAVKSVLDGDTEALGLAGLLRLRAALDDTTDADVERHESRRALLAARRTEVDADLAAAVPEPLDEPAFVLEAVRALAGGNKPAVVDDAFVPLADDVCAAVLDALATDPPATPLVYLTDDVRVLAWAIGLPPAVGGVVGALEPAAPEGGHAGGASR